MGAEAARLTTPYAEPPARTQRAFLRPFDLEAELKTLSPITASADACTGSANVRCIATGIESSLEALRLIWADDTSDGAAAAWTRLTNGLELLTTAQVQERFAAEGIEMTANAAAQLQVDAINQRPGTELTIIPLNDEHAVSSVDLNDGAVLHDERLVVTDVGIVNDGGATC